MLVSVCIAVSNQKASCLTCVVLDDGRAAEIFGRMAPVFGDQTDFVSKSGKYLSRADVDLAVKAERNGFASSISTRDIDLLVVALYGGRMRPEDKVDYAGSITKMLPVEA